MKKIFLALSLLPIICFAQDHVSEFWKIDKWLTDEVINAQTQELYLIDPLTNPEEMSQNSGNTLTFRTNGTFVSEHFAYIAVDCYPSSKGRFKKIDDNHIHLRISLYKQMSPLKGCEKIRDVTKRDLGIFKIEPTKEGYRLIKSPLSSSNP